MEPYYYSRMNKTEQTAYHAMEQGFRQLASEIQIPYLEPRALFDVFFLLRLDHPDIFWAVSYKYRHYQDSPNLILLPEYLFTNDKIREHQKALRSRIEKLSRPARDMSEWEKEKYIHDFICTHVNYDKLKKPYSHEIIGPLGQGTGVCEGIAKSVKILCDALGIWCMIAMCGNNPDKGIKYRHVWNIVRIGKTYYHLDATFDNSLTRAGKNPQDIRYDYFNLDDQAVFRDHEPLIAPAPSCTDHDHFYYKEKKLSFTKIEDVYKRSLQAAKKGRCLTYHWRGGYLTRDILKQLMEEMQRAGKERDRYAYISLNWPQAVIRLHYEEQIPESDMIMDEANEGEKYAIAE
ncbi:MAG: transglutaminase domain-containing protein [Eubacteriales bacterium]|nr:transglutaminase domain-containing protein [Eubacteriales bacterium]